MLKKINKIEDLIKDNPYVGRGIILGKSPCGKKAIAVYFIMGRSDNSRNRVFIQEGQDIRIEPFDPSKVEDPSLIIYYPVRKLENRLIITNGDQTDTILAHLQINSTFEDALKTREFEPDKPNFTPRISGILNMNKNDLSYKLSILKSGDDEGTVCTRNYFNYQSLNGVGHFIHTYQCDGNPLPTFEGEPRKIEIIGDLEEIVNNVWNNLNEENKISILGKSIDLETLDVKTVIINKNK